MEHPETLDLGFFAAIQQHFIEIQEMYHIIYENKYVCSQCLAPWIEKETFMSSGFNYLMCLRVRDGFDDEQYFSARLYQEVGVTTFPLLYFIIDPQVLASKKVPGHIWVRVSCAVPEEDFLKCIELVRVFLTRFAG